MERERKHLKITSDGTGAGTEVWLDGAKLEGGQKLTFDVAAREASVVTIETLLGTLVYEADVTEVEDSILARLERVEKLLEDWSGPEGWRSIKVDDQATGLYVDALKECEAELRKALGK